MLEKFETLNKKVGSMRATAFLSRLYFSSKVAEKIKIDGVEWFRFDRQGSSEWFGFGKKKNDQLLVYLINKGTVEKKIKLWKGRRCTFLRIRQKVEDGIMHFGQMDALTKKTGSFASAMIYAKIVFHSAGSTIYRDGLCWCAVKRKHLADWAGMSVRTVDRILSEHQRSKRLVKRDFGWNGRSQSHWHIPQIACSEEKTARAVFFDNSLKKK